MEEVTEMGGWIPVKESWMKNPCLYDLRYLPPLSALGAWERPFLTCLGGRSKRDYEGKPPSISRRSSSRKLISRSRSLGKKRLGGICAGWTGRGHGDAHSTTPPSPPPSPGVIIIPIGYIKELKSFPSKTTPPSQAGGSNDLL